MANEINYLGTVLEAIGRQIASGKHSPTRGDRPERDLPILLLPNAALHLTGTDRRRTEESLPYLLGQKPVELDPVSSNAVTAPRMPAIRILRPEGALLRLDPRTMRGLA